MSDRVIVTRSLLENVASSIRKKTKTNKTLTLKGMVQAVDGILTAEDVNTENLARMLDMLSFAEHYDYSYSASEVAEIDKLATLISGIK